MVQLKKQWLAVAVIGFLLTILLLPFLQFKTVFFGDNYSLLVPGKVFTSSWLRQGLIPLWNPYSFGGISWIGDINQSVLYPSSVLFAGFHPSLALNLTIILHLVISATGMYLLTGAWLKYSQKKQITRSQKQFVLLLATILWVFSQKTVGSINNLSILQSLTWMPWVVWAGMRLPNQKKLHWKPLIIGAVLVTLQLAGGYPQHVIYSVGLAILLSGWLWWSRGLELRYWLRSWLIMGFLALALSAVIWAPFLPTLQQSTRTIQSAEQSIKGSLHPIEVAKFVLPYLFEKPTSGIKWGPNWNRTPSEITYVTWIGLFILGLFGWQRKFSKKDIFLLAVSALATIMAIGGFLPGFNVLQTVLPLLKIVRNPSSLLVIPSLLLPLLLAPKIISTKFELSFWRKIVITSGSLLLLSTGLWLLHRFYFTEIWQLTDSLINARLSQSYFHTLEKDRLIAEMIIENLIIASGLFFASLLALQQKKYTLLVLLIGFDLIYHTCGSLFFAPHTIYPSWPEIQQRQLEISLGPTHNSRYLIRNGNQPYTDFNTYWDALSVRQPFTDSFIDSEEMSYFTVLKQLSRGLTPNWHQVYQVPTINGYTTLLPKDVNQIWNDSQEVAINQLPPIALDNSLLSQWAVKRYLVDSWFAVGEDTTTLPLLTTSRNWQTYQLLAEDKIRLTTGQRLNLVSVDENPNQLVIKILPTSNPSEVVIANRYDPDWGVLVNGQSVPIKNTEGMISFAIPEGTEQIVLTYQPWHFYLGLTVTLVTALLMSGWWLGLGWLRKFSTRHL